MAKPHVAYQTFDEGFFSRNQRWLLWLLNTPVVRLWFRWVMRIPSCDCLRGVRIHSIAPNYFDRDRKLIFEKGEWRLEQTRTFFGYPKYSKRIYHAFLPIWWMLHAWDYLIADSFWPELSFGFSALTAYPQAGGGGGNVSCDGRVTCLTSGVSWATLIAESSGTAAYSLTTDNTDNIVNIQANTTSNTWLDLCRGIFSFDTSSLGCAAISAATFSIYGAAQSDALSIAPNYDVYGWTPASNANNIVAADFGACGSTSYTGNSPITYAGYSTSGYNNSAFNSTGMEAINLTKPSCFSVRNANYDVSGTPPSWSGGANSSLFNCYMADNGSNEPKLTVTYSWWMPPPFNMGPILAQ
jgi:hypothetical protein